MREKEAEQSKEERRGKIKEKERRTKMRAKRRDAAQNMAPNDIITTRWQRPLVATAPL